MSAITPQTNLRLLKYGCSNTKDHTVDFDSVTEQTNFFKGLPYYNSSEYDNFTYQRANSVIRFPASIDSIMNYNYVMYNNDYYQDKWFYAFITRMEYINDNLTYIYIETDYIQTYLFNYTINGCFVEREHVADDTYGKHTLPENLDTGEYITYSKNRLQEFNAVNCQLIIGTGIDIHYGATSPFVKIGGGLYNGIPSGYSYFRYPILSSTATGNKDFRSLLNRVDLAGLGDSIHTMFLAPIFTFDYDYDTGEVTQSYEAKTQNWSSFSSFTTYPAVPTNLNGYTPKNNKMFCYPYCFLLADNGAGSTFDYHFEKFTLPSYCDFTVASSVCPSMSLTLYPRDYEGETINKLYGFNGSKFPQCSWNSDAYTNWMTKNSVQTSIVSTAATGVMGVLTKDSKTSGGALGKLGDLYSQINQHSLAPDTIIGNAGNGDNNYSMDNLGFTLYVRGIKKEYAEIIDNFFTMYGYKVNEVKTPNTKSRRYWNYIKTRNCTIKDNSGLMSNEAKEQIGKLFDNGITFWHNMTISNFNDRFLDYSYTNSIVS